MILVADGGHYEGRTSSQIEIKRSRDEVAAYVFQQGYAAVQQVVRF
jgi:hypothetical protein